jgi:hypothetical protein
MVNGDYRTIDVADQAIAKDDVRDLPIATSPDIRQRLKRIDAGGFASGLIAKCLVGKLRQFRVVLSNGRDRTPVKQEPASANDTGLASK